MMEVPVVERRRRGAAGSGLWGDPWQARDAPGRRVSARLALAVLTVVLVSGLSTSVEARKKRAMIIIYDGFGTPEMARVSGRVLEDKGFTKAQEGERWTRRIRRSWRLLESDEIEDARLQVTIGTRRFTLKSDDEGLFSVHVRGLGLGAHEVRAKLLETRPYRLRAGRIFVAPKPEPKGALRLAVISDIDDTVLQTGVKNKLKLIKKVLLSNATQLKTYRDAPALFRRFAARGFPVVFVSGSPINLYPRLRAFFRLRGFPRAPMLLKNLGVGKGSDSLFGQKTYKLKRITEAFRLLPRYRFILIGDSGEKDPEIYRAVAKRFPKRVAAVLIHNVSHAKADDDRYQGQYIFAGYRQAVDYLVRKKILPVASVAGGKAVKGKAVKGKAVKAKAKERSLVR